MEEARQQDMSDVQDAINRLQRAQVDVSIATSELSRTAWHVAAALTLEGEKADGIELLDRMTKFLAMIAKGVREMTTKVAQDEEDEEEEHRE